ncbi:hypothetical protein Nepgr_008029 [Nepenthes gracilis]|uniref:Uncharacterized protein n=1 Tax=Nepenthes gracilis TaxID=150966 RepID=A0AAD3S8C7_NEPGR|nr:hypothetical protein Nepgr_008029 [Nepenthes gracilis]
MAPNGISTALEVLPLPTIFSLVDRRAVNHKLEVPVVSAGVQWSGASTPLTKSVGWHDRCLPILAQFQLETTDPVSSFGKFGMKSWQPDAIFKLELWLKASFSLGMPKELVHPVVEIF